MFLWDFVVEVGFGAGGACPFLPRLTFLDLILRALMWFGFIFESVCILAAVIFCLDVGLRGLRLVSVVVERAFCDVLVDVFF